MCALIWRPGYNYSCINMHLISLLSAELILWPICALSRFRISPKSLETSQHGGQGLLSPFYSHLFEFRKFLPLDRSQRRIILFIYIYMLIIYNFNNRKKKYWFYKILSLQCFNLHMIFTYKYLCYINVNFCDTNPNFL